MRGGCTPGNSRRVAARDNSRLGQLAALVLIKRLAHVRGPVPGFSIRARGRRLNAAPVQEKNARARRGLLKKPSPPSLGGHLPQRGSQVGAPPKACAKPSLASPFGGRWCPVGTVQRLVSAAASVGAGRSPLGCITRAGRRECPRRGRRGLREATFLVRYRPGKTLRCFPSFLLCAARL